jgi:hypothetical protein
VATIPWEAIVLYMVLERFRAPADDIYRRVREHGRLLPKGLEYEASWVDLERTRCFQLMRTDDPSLFAVWQAHWSDLVDFEVIEVQSSAQASAIGLSA